MIVEMTTDQWDDVLDALPDGWAKKRIAGFIRGREAHRSEWVQVTRSLPDGRSATETWICNDHDDMLNMCDAAREGMSEYRADHPWREAVMAASEGEQN